MSRSLGLKDIKTVKRASATGLYFSLMFAALLAIFSIVLNNQVLHILGTDVETYDATRNYMYWTVSMGSVPGIMSIMFGFLLRAEGKSFHASIGQISGCIINIILDPFFILPFGLDMGVAGAGFATFIGHCVACSYFLILLFKERKNTSVSLNPRNITINKAILLGIFMVGFPGVVQNNLNVISMTILNNIAASYGPNSVAAIGIANKVNQLPIQIIFGFTQGVMPLIGYNYAAKNYARLSESVKKTYIATLSGLLLVLLLFNLAGTQIIRFFMDNNEIVSVGARFLSGFGLSLPFLCMDFMAVGVSQSFGYGKHALIFSILRKLAFEIPLIYVLSASFGVYGLAYAQCLAEFMMAVISIFVMKSLMQKAKMS